MAVLEARTEPAVERDVALRHDRVRQHALGAHGAEEHVALPQLGLWSSRSGVWLCCLAVFLFLSKSGWPSRAAAEAAAATARRQRRRRRRVGAAEEEKEEEPVAAMKAVNMPIAAHTGMR